MAGLKRFFLFTLVRATLRLFSWKRDIVERDRKLHRLTQALNHSQDGALIPARIVQERFRLIRDELETKHMTALATLLEQLRIGTEERMMLAREIVAKNYEIEARDAKIVRLGEAAMTDPLTGLYNRRGAGEAFHRLLSVFERQNQQTIDTGYRTEIHDLSVLVFDLNHFKEVNDRFGHAAGDTILMIIAEHLKRAFRTEDILVRPGGDEFKVYLVNATRAGAISRAEKLKALMCADDRLQFDDVRVTVSIGISHGRFATKRGGLQIIKTLEQLADIAMYAAKEKSRTVNGITVTPDAVSSDTVLDSLLF